VAQDDIELIRRLYDSFNERGIDAVFDWLDPAIVWVNPSNSIDHQVFHGHEGVAKWFHELLEPQFESAKFYPEDFVELGGQIVVRLRACVRTRGSEHELEAPFAHLVTVRDGKVTSMRMFSDQAQAMRAAEEAPTEGR
jgi:ketosteroid isomerase-like protein